MKRVAIIGANGQVGAEVCLLLRDRGDIEPVPVCRTDAGAAFLRHQGVACRTGTAADPDQAGKLLEGCDAVADFTLPTGSASEVREQMRALIPAAVAASPAGAPYVYLSSITALGFRDFQSPLGWHSISRNAYGSSKRYAERLVRAACKKTARPAHILRVGVVHGELQAVTREMTRRLRANADRLAAVPDCPSYTVFAFEIAAALAAIAQGKVSPETYTLLSNPGWSWAEVHEYLTARAGIAKPRYRLIASDARPNAVGRAARTAAAPFRRLLWKQKDLVQGYLSASLPRVEQRLRATYHCRNAESEIRAGELANEYRPYGNNHSAPPGRRIDALPDSRTAMAGAARRLRARLGRTEACAEVAPA